MRRSKKGDLAVTVLIFMAVALAGASTAIFLTSERGIEDRLVDARFIDGIYMTEGKLDFYINDIMEASASGFKEEEGREKFVENFKQELGKYKENGDYILSEFIQVEKQINEYETRNNVQVEAGKATVELSILVGSGMQEKKFNAVHTYNKKFEKTIPVETATETPSQPAEETSATVNLAEKARVPESDLDRYYVYFNGVKTEYFLIKTTVAVQS